MSEEVKTLIMSISNGLNAIKANKKILGLTCPNITGEQKKNIYKATVSLIENMIEDLEQLKVDMQPKDKPTNSFGEGEKTEADKAREEAPWLANYLPKL